MDNNKAGRPERRTALVPKELERYKIDIAALSKTCLPNEGQLTEEYGKKGVGFTIKNHLIHKLISLPKGVNDWLMTFLLLLRYKHCITIISAYGTTMTNSDEVRDKFCEELDSLIIAVPKSCMLHVPEDFNVHVGKKHKVWNGVIGKHGVGNCNRNGLLLLRTCTMHDLLIANKVFHIDYIFTS